MLDLLQIKVHEVTPLPRHENKHNTWWLPEQGTFKLNYDGATKGNLGPASFGGVFRNSKGDIIWIYDGNIGSSTNNSAELHALEHGITIVHDLNLSPLIVEGDSTLATQIDKKLQQGIEVENISEKWCLDKIIQWIKQGIDIMAGLQFQQSEGREINSWTNW